MIVSRKRNKDVALVPTMQLKSLMETTHLLRSPKNARRLLAAVRRAQGRRGKPESIEKLRQEMGLPESGKQGTKRTP